MFRIIYVLMLGDRLLAERFSEEEIKKTMREFQKWDSLDGIEPRNYRIEVTSRYFGAVELKLM